jgi:hypothetical protein
VHALLKQAGRAAGSPAGGCQQRSSLGQASQAVAAPLLPLPRCCRYDDVVNEGNLEMDTPHEEADPPGPDDTDSWADTQREVRGWRTRSCWPLAGRAARCQRAAACTASDGC